MNFKMIRYCVLGLVIVLLISSCASKPITKETWTYLGETNGGDIKHYVNLSTMKRNGVLTQLVSKNILKSPETTSFLKGRKYAYDINQWEINCKTVKVKLLSADYYSATDQLIFTYKIQGPIPSPVPKDSILASLYHLGCAVKEK